MGGGLRLGGISVSMAMREERRRVAGRVGFSGIRGV